MLGFTKWVQNIVAKRETEEISEVNNYFLKNKMPISTKLAIEKSFNPLKPNCILKFTLGKTYYEFPDFLQSEYSAKA